MNGTVEIKIEVKTISRLERLGTATDGCPYYRVFFTDGTSAQTVAVPDVSYSITNPEFIGNPIRITSDSNGIFQIGEA